MKKIFLTSLIIICIGAICVCSAFISEGLYEYESENAYYKDVAKKSYENTRIDFDSLRAKNSDIVGWITIPGTRIDYPIVKGSDNDQYLHTLFSGKEGDSGCLFTDYRSEPFRSSLTIVYGHRMKDGSMFSNLGFYRKRGFADKHQSISIYTPDKSYKLKILLFATIGANNNVYNEYFTSAMNVYDLLKKHAQYTYDKPKNNDKLVMLSTCAYEFKNARYVLLGKLQ